MRRGLDKLGFIFVGILLAGGIFVIAAGTNNVSHSWNQIGGLPADCNTGEVLTLQSGVLTCISRPNNNFNFQNIADVNTPAPEIISTTSITSNWQIIDLASYISGSSYAPSDLMDVRAVVLRSKYSGAYAWAMGGSSNPSYWTGTGGATGNPPDNSLQIAYEYSGESSITEVVVPVYPVNNAGTVKIDLSYSVGGPAPNLKTYLVGYYT